VYQSWDDCHIFHPTGNVDADIAYIKSVMGQFKGRFPENGVY
jgi:hypothetical protein